MIQIDPFDPTGNSPYITDINEVLSWGLPVLDIQTENDEEPWFEKVTHPEGSMGEGITNTNKIPGSVTRYEANGDISYNSGDYKKKESGMTIKVRGNTSAYTSKKPYKIKLEKKADLLVRGDKKYNDKNWVLLKDPDMRIRNGFWVNGIMEMDWTPACEYVNVMFNGKYRGLYLLCEAVEQNEKCRIDVSESGFIIEFDAYWWNEDGAYLNSMYLPRYGYSFKYPDYEDITPEQLEWMQNHINEYESSMLDGSYEKYIDIESFANFLLAHDILGTYDGGGSNKFLSKYDNTSESKIRRPLLWDFDSTEGYGNNSDQPSAMHYFYKKEYGDLFNLEQLNPFMKAYCAKWLDVKERVFEDMVLNLVDYQDSEASKYFDTSAEQDNLLWETLNNKSAVNTERAIDWYTNRHDWMNNWLAEISKKYSDDLTSVELPKIEEFYKIVGRQIIAHDCQNIILYSLQGQIVKQSNVGVITVPSPGMYLLKIGQTIDKVVVR